MQTSGKPSFLPLPLLSPIAVSRAIALNWRLHHDQNCTGRNCFWLHAWEIPVREIFHRSDSRALTLTRSRLMQSGVLLLISLVPTACETAPSILNPRGPNAARAADLWWIMLGIAGLVYLFVVALLFYSLFRRRRSDTTRAVSDNDGSRFILANGVAMPAVILSVLFVLTLGTLVG
jgi:hypothetical protein